MTDPMVEAYLHWMTKPPQHYSPVSVAHRRRVLYRAAHVNGGLDEIDPSWVDRYIWRADLSGWSRRTYYTALHGLCAWAYAHGWLSYDPTEDTKVPPPGSYRAKSVTVAQLRYALAHAEDPWLTLVILGAGAGLRASEAAAADREDVTQDWVHVRHGKGDRERWVGTAHAVWTHVKDRPPGPLLRHPRTGRRVSGNWVSSAQRAAFDALGLPDLHPHRLRHTFAQVMYDAGTDLLVIRDQMGHASVATTQGYLQTTDDKRRRGVDAVDEALGGSPAGA
jgi:integrase